MKQYGIHSVTGDKFSGDWASNSFASHGIFYERSPKSKSELYVEAEGAFNTGRIMIPDKETLVTQLKCLVRKVRPGGKDAVDADIPEDEANCCVGACWQLLSLAYEKPIPPSLGISADEVSEEERTRKRMLDWLLDRPPKRKKKPKDNEVDMDEIVDQVIGWEEEIFKEEAKRDSASSVKLTRGWGDDD